jgi:hypothetical protein
MSLSSVAPQSCVAVYDPNIDINSHKYYTILKGCVSESITEVQSSSQSSSTWTFPYVAPSRQAVLKKRFRIGAHATIRLQKSAGPTNLLQENGDALRAFALSSLFETVKCDVGNTTVNVQLNQIVHPLSRIAMDYHNRQMVNNGVPSCLDKSQAYEMLVGDALNPLQQWGTCSREGEDGRGAWNYDIAFTAPTTDVTIETDLMEEILLSPFIFCNEDHAGLVGLDRIQFTISLSSNKQRIWSGTGKKQNVNDTDVTVTVTLSNPKLYVSSLILPNEMLSTIPKMYTNKYNEIEYIPYNTRSNFTGVGSQLQITTDQMQLKGVPNKLIAFVRKPLDLCSYNDPDTYARIDDINIKFGGVSGVLSTLNTYDLYQMSRKNGLQNSLQDWRGEFSEFLGDGTKNIKNYGIGSVLVLEFGTDIPLMDGCAGMGGNRQFSITINCTNLKKNVAAGNPQSAAFVPYAPEVGLCFVYEGLFTIDTENSHVTTEIGIVSKSDYDNARPVDAVSYYDIKEIVGGNFLSSFKNILGKYVRPALSVANKANEMAEKVGLGHSGGGHSGGTLEGGKVAKKTKLADRLKN